MYKLVKAMTSFRVPKEKQELNLQALKVGPSQFPDIYQMTVDCARILGIGIPTVFVKPEADINAYTIASEDDAPIVVLNSGLVERFTPGEIKCVIGHECGHIHNNHSIYDYAAQIIINKAADTTRALFPGIQKILQLATIPIRLALLAWSRAMEVTCDRAGVICSDDVNDEITAKCKFLYGAAYNREVNVDAVLKQYDAIKSTPVRFLELGADHPVPVRRIFAVKEFINSDVLYKWRPELKKAGMRLINKQELDMRCDKYIGVIKSEGGK